MSQKDLPRGSLILPARALCYVISRGPVPEPTPHRQVEKRTGVVCLSLRDSAGFNPSPERGERQPPPGVVASRAISAGIVSESAESRVA